CGLSGSAGGDADQGRMSTRRGRAGPVPWDRNDSGGGEKLGATLRWHRTESAVHRNGTGAPRTHPVPVKLGGRREPSPLAQGQPSFNHIVAMLTVHSSAG